MPLPHAPRARPVDPRTEAHITLVHGPRPSLLHACAAAVNAEALRRADPTRARIAFAWNISEAALEILSHGWSVRLLRDEVDGTLIDTLSGQKSVVLNATLDGQSEPATRAIFWDVRELMR